MTDLLDYLRGAVGPDGVNGKPVGVRHKDGDRTFDGINQVQRDGQTKRWFQVKGSWNDPPPQSDWEELWYDDAYIYRAIDTSRKPSEGGPYTLTDEGASRGSKWIKRQMNVGDKFFRNPTIYPFNMATGVRDKAEGEAPTWIKLVAIHPLWQGIPDVAELHWLLHENDTAPAERTFYAKGLGQVGFIGSGMTTTPNSAFPDFPPATGIPVLVRKPAPWLPAMPADSASTDLIPGLTLSWPMMVAVITSRFGAARDYSKIAPTKLQLHEGIDLDSDQLTVTAALAGKVTAVGYNANGYGNYVRTQTELNGDKFDVWYGHLERADVKVGDNVTTTTVIGKAGKTGNVFGTDPTHLHLTLVHVGKGMKNYVVDDVIDPLPYLGRVLPVVVTPPVVTPPVTPEPEPDTAPPFEVEFDTIEERDRVGQMLINIGERILSAPGRRVSITVSVGQ